MALIDEYKQAIQDVLDGRAKPAPKPSELPWSEDKAATMWAAAAAELIAEASAGEALPDTPGTDGTYALQNTVESGTGTLSWASGGGGGESGCVAIPITYAAGHLYLDASYNDIIGYIEEGKAVFAVLAGDAGYAQWMYVNSASGGGSFAVNFMTYQYGGAQQTVFTASSATEDLVS